MPEAEKKSRFMYDKDHPIVLKTRCHLCIHKFSGAPGCSAYPLAIPYALAAGVVQHDSPYPGDNGVLFEMNPKYARKEE